MKINIYRCHIDVENETVTIEFRSIDDNQKEHPPVGYARYSTAISSKCITEILTEVNPKVLEEISKLPTQVVRSHVVTSELHILNDTRAERRMHENNLSKVKEEHKKFIEQAGEEQIKINAQLENMRKKHEEKKEEKE